MLSRSMPGRESALPRICVCMQREVGMDEVAWAEWGGAEEGRTNKAAPSTKGPSSTVNDLHFTGGRVAGFYACRLRLEGLPMGAKEVHSNFMLFAGEGMRPSASHHHHIDVSFPRRTVAVGTDMVSNQ